MLLSLRVQTEAADPPLPSDPPEPSRGYPEAHGKHTTTPQLLPRLWAYTTATQCVWNQQRASITPPGLMETGGQQGKKFQDLRYPELHLGEVPAEAGHLRLAHC